MYATPLASDFNCYACIALVDRTIKAQKNFIFCAFNL